MLTTETPSNRMDSTNVERLARLHLARTGYSRLSAVECSFRDGTILLHGIVPSYYHKQMAQEALRQIRHVYRVVNNLEVFA
jgi:osmotically-inducible protein OsmY